MEEGIRLLRPGKEADEIDGIALEDVGVGDVESAIVDAEIAGRADVAARAPAQRIEQPAKTRGRLDLLHLERRAQDGREIAHVLGDQEVVLHEALDGSEPAAVDIAEPLRHGLLHIECQPLFGAPRQEMQMAAHAP